MSIFSRLTTLEQHRPRSEIVSLNLPSSILRLSITCATKCEVEEIWFLPSLLEVKLNKCGITTIDGDYLPPNLSSLSFNENELRKFRCLLSKCKFLRLGMNDLKEVHRFPFLELLVLLKNELLSISHHPESLESLLTSPDNLFIINIRPFSETQDTYVVRYKCIERSFIYDFNRKSRTYWNN